MADAYPSLPRWQRWNIRTLPKSEMLTALAFLVIPVLIVIFALVASVIFLVALLIDALT